MKSKSKGRLGTEIFGWSLNSPYLAYSAIFFLIPIVWAFWLSTMDWNLMSKNREFVGVNNFIDLFSDKRVQAAFFNSFRYLLAIVLLTVIAGVVVGLLVYHLPRAVKGICSVLFFIPYLTSGVATAVVMRYLLSDNGLLSTFLRDTFGISVKWLQDKNWTFWVIVLLVVWKMAGYYGLFFLSGLESISADIYEAAMIDGSTGLHRFFHIILPMILPTMTTVIVLAAGLGFGIFTEPYLLTGGGPASTTTTWQLEIYNASFVKFQSGYGAAMALACAVQIFITIKLITMAMNRVNKKFGA